MKKQLLVAFLIFSSIIIVLFSQTFLRGYIPFPGDLLISEYQPWKSSSYLGYTPGSYPHKAQYFDTIRQIYPWKAFVVSEIKQGRWPLWNPYNFSGTPLLANLQSAVLYPTTLLFLIFPMTSAWTLSIMLQPFLAASFMYLYLRQQKLSFFSAVFGGICYGVSLYMTVFLQYNTIGHVILWLPFILYGIDSFIHTQQSRYLFIIALGNIFSLFAGHLQLFAGVFIFSCVYILIQFNSYQKKLFASLFVVLMLSLGMGAIQLIPTLELTSLAARSNHEYSDMINRLLIQPKQLFMAIIPDLYGNPATRNYLLSDSYPGKALFISTFGIFFAVCAFRLRNKKVLFFSLTVMLLLVFLVHTPFTALFYRLPLPFISASAPTNYLFIMICSLSVLAGFGMERLLKQRTVSNKLLMGLSTIPLILFIFSSQLHVIRSQTIFSIIMLSIVWLVVLLSRVKTVPMYIIAGIILIGTTIDLGYFFLKFNPFVPKELVFPETPIVTTLKNISGTNRFWGYGAAAIEANFATQYQLFSPEGYDPLYPSWYGMLMNYSLHGDIVETFSRSTRSDARFLQGFGKDGFKHEYRSRVINVLGTKFILDHQENALDQNTVPEDTYSLRHRDQGWLIYENSNALPRAFVTSKKPEELTLNDPIPIASHSAVISHYSPLRVQIDVSSQENGYLILSDTYFPGWQAWINDTPVPITKTLIALRSVPVSHGTSTIIFEYRPPSFIIGGIVSLASLVFMSIFVQLQKKLVWPKNI